jgi:hypothetical protein
LQVPSVFADPCRLISCRALPHADSASSRHAFGGQCRGIGARSWSTICPRRMPRDPRLPKPASAAPKVPPRFRADLVISGLQDPRALRIAPNGDVFIAETAIGRIRVLRIPDNTETITSNDVFASGLNGPFGMAFYPPGSEPGWLYVASTTSVVRYRYASGTCGRAKKLKSLSHSCPARAAARRSAGTLAVTSPFRQTAPACSSRWAQPQTMPETSTGAIGCGSHAGKHSHTSADRFTLSKRADAPYLCGRVGQPGVLQRWCSQSGIAGAA